MLKIPASSEKSTLRAFRAGNNKVVGGNDGRADEIVVDLFKFKNKKSRKSTCMPNIGATRKPNFLTFDANKVFNHLQLAFIKAPIFRHFDLKNHIRIETNASGYAISGMLSQ